MLCTCIFHFCTFRSRTRAFDDMFCSFDVSTWRQHFSFLSPPLGRSYQFNSRIVSKHFRSKRLGIIEERLQKREVTFTDDVNFRRHRCRPSLSSLFLTEEGDRNAFTGTCNFNVEWFVPALSREIEIKYSCWITKVPLSKEHRLTCLSFHTSLCIIISKIEQPNGFLQLKELFP